MNTEEQDECTMLRKLKTLKPYEMETYLEMYRPFMQETRKPFAGYMRKVFKQKGIREKDVFRRANISDGYGYKIISEEKRTNNRDIIIRLCLAMKMSLDETQKALQLGGFTELQHVVKRDSIIIMLICNNIFDITTVNAFLEKFNEPTLEQTTGGISHE